MLSIYLVLAALVVLYAAEVVRTAAQFANPILDCRATFHPMREVQNRVAYLRRVGPLREYAGAVPTEPQDRHQRVLVTSHSRVDVCGFDGVKKVRETFHVFIFESLGRVQLPMQRQ